MFDSLRDVSHKVLLSVLKVLDPSKSPLKSLKRETLILVPPFLSYGVHTSPSCLRFGLFRPLNPQFWANLGGLGGDSITCVYTIAFIKGD
jgi:hypothetical protein